jgi:hypothetical protein
MPVSRAWSSAPCRLRRGRRRRRHRVRPRVRRHGPTPVAGSRDRDDGLAGLPGRDRGSEDAARAKADIARVSRNAAQTRDAVAFLRALPYLPRDDAARLAHIARLPSPRRDAAALRVAERLARDAVYVAFANRVTPELLSKRLGCVVEQPVFPGLDLAALCLR